MSYVTTDQEALKNLRFKIESDPNIPIREIGHEMIKAVHITFGDTDQTQYNTWLSIWKELNETTTKPVKKYNNRSINKLRSKQLQKYNQRSRRQ